MSARVPDPSECVVFREKHDDGPGLRAFINRCKPRGVAGHIFRDRETIVCQQFRQCLLRKVLMVARLGMRVNSERRLLVDCQALCYLVVNRLPYRHRSVLLSLSVLLRQPETPPGRTAALTSTCSPQRPPTPEYRHLCSSPSASGQHSERYRPSPPSGSPGSSRPRHAPR